MNRRFAYIFIGMVSSLVLSAARCGGEDHVTPGASGSRAGETDTSRSQNTTPESQRPANNP